MTFLALLEGVVPGKPRDLTVIEATKNYVVLSWKPPGDKGYEGVMYYVEKVQNLYSYIITFVMHYSIQIYKYEV